jgi:cell division septum initiation protein DivIVA
MKIAHIPRRAVTACEDGQQFQRIFDPHRMTRGTSVAMTMNETPPAFDIVLRGYERRQVDEHLSTLVTDRMAAERKAGELEKQVARVRAEYEASDHAEPNYATLGARVEKILRLAEEEARDLRAEADSAGEQTRAKAGEDAEAIRKAAEAEAERRRSEAEANSEKMLEQAKVEAERIRTEAGNESQAKLTSAENIVEEARAKAAQIATEVEAKLAKRREQAERDMATRQEVAERRLMETGEKADALRMEAQKMRDDAERRAKQLLEAARREAEDLVADARAKSERQRLESERELAALTHRRDSINAQLSNVREMLATLTGSAAALIGGGAPAAAEPGPMPPQQRGDATAMPAQSGDNGSAAG